MPQTGLELAYVALTTVGTIVMIGLGFLYRPSRAAFLWSVAFLLAMVCAYGQLVASAIGAPALRWAALGAVLAAPAFAWSGLRALREARPLAWIAPLLAVAGAAALVAAGPTDAYAWVFRVVYLASAAFAALTLVELVRRPDRGGGMSLPLALFSASFVALALTMLITGIAMPVLDPGSLAMLRELNLLGMLVAVVCALVTLLCLARGEGSDRAAGSAFHTSAADRLARAQQAGERSWTVLVVRLDDGDDLRAAGGEAGFADVCARFHTDVRSSLPTDADIGMLDDTTAVVLVARPTSVIRELVRVMLRRISALDPEDAVKVQLSASVGWAGVAEHGYDLDALVAAAGSAADQARSAGGDRWERSVGDTTEPAVSL